MKRTFGMCLWEMKLLDQFDLLPESLETRFESRDCLAGHLESGLRVLVGVLGAVERGLETRNAILQKLQRTKARKKLKKS